MNNEETLKILQQLKELNLEAEDDLALKQANKKNSILLYDSWNIDSAEKSEKTSNTVLNESKEENDDK